MLFLWGERPPFFSPRFLGVLWTLQECTCTGTFVLILSVLGSFLCVFCALFVVLLPSLGTHSPLLGPFLHSLAPFSVTWGRKATDLAIMRENPSAKGPKGAFCHHEEVTLGTIFGQLLLTFSHFVILQKLRSRVGGSAFFASLGGARPYFFAHPAPPENKLFKKGPLHPPPSPPPPFHLVMWSGRRCPRLKPFLQSLVFAGPHPELKACVSKLSGQSQPQA